MPRPPDEAPLAPPDELLIDDALEIGLLSIRSSSVRRVAACGSARRESLDGGARWLLEGARWLLGETWMGAAQVPGCIRPLGEPDETK